MMLSHKAVASIVITNVIQTQEICDLSNGTLTIIATGGNGDPLFYSVNGGITFQESNFFDNLDSDDYFITVTDGTICSQDFTAQVTSAATPLISIDVDCIEGQGLTNIDLVPFPTGIPPYTFQWIGPAGMYTTEDLALVPSGAYSVLVSDSFGCTIDTSFVVEACCGFQLGCVADTTIVTCLNDFQAYTNATFDTLNQADKIEFLDRLFDIDVLAIPCSDLTVDVTNVESADTACETPMTIVTTIEVSDNINSYVCNKTFLIENYIEIGITKDAEDQVVSCDEDVDALFQQFILDNGGAEFNGCASQYTVLTEPANPVLNFTCTGSATVEIFFLLIADCVRDTTVAVFSVEDQIVPVILACPADIVIEVSDNISEEINNWMATFSSEDACGTVTLTNDLELESIDQCESLDMPVRFIATDDCGNISSCESNIQLSTSASPSLTCPVELTIECKANLSEDVGLWLSMAEGFDADGQPLVVTNDYDSNVLATLNCDDQFTVEFTASNACEETKCLASFNVVDSTAPCLLYTSPSPRDRG